MSWALSQTTVGKLKLERYLLAHNPYKARLITTYIKLFLDASPSLLACLSFFMKIKFFTADFEKVDYIIENSDGYIVFACAILFIKNI